uniref:Uncharacterized protein n=1 Tax=Siphoviridae sp. ctKcB20 TaxID=2827568 RepID=A0A8S5LLR9_9CAUD|nr:MAG TPA: hypothetical protein [Siphoviridae sp. ctKcB20]
MNVFDVEHNFMSLYRAGKFNEDADVRIHIGNQLYDIDRIDTAIDMDSNKPNIVIHVKEN